MRFAFAVTLVALVVGPKTAGATVIANWDLDTVITHADVAVIGVVGESQSVKAHGRLLTETKLSVTRTLLGKASPWLVVSQPGGQDGDIVTDVPGTVRLPKGATVLLILNLGRDGRFYIVGLCLGAYAVHDDTVTQHIDVPLASTGGVLLPPPLHRSRPLKDIEAAIARRRR